MKWKNYGAMALALLSSYAIFWPGSGRNWVEIDVMTGTSAHQIANQLVDKGVVRFKLPFLAWVKLRGADSRIRLGRYRFSVGRSSFWLVDDFVQGRTQKIRVVIPEGFSSWQIADRLEALKLCNAADFKDIVAREELEGFLFPAVYDFDFGMDAARIAQAMKVQLDQRWTAEMDQRAKELGWTQKEALTMASIVEREVVVREELPLVSAVYHNRLRKKMNLQADPTVQYSLGYWKKRLTYDDYKHANSPYNTYLNAGLPPGPICSPGSDAIRAALWPAQSDALFFVAIEEGRHSFSTSYRDHTNKVNRRNAKSRQKQKAG